MFLTHAPKSRLTHDRVAPGARFKPFPRQRDCYLKVLVLFLEIGLDATPVERNHAFGESLAG